MPNPAARPRHAASVLLVRPNAAGEPTVLMGRRSRRAAFAPDVFVFPGGRVDAEDEHLPVVNALKPQEASRLMLGGQASPKLARSLATAAVRETWEETGYLLGDSLDQAGRIKPDHEPLRFLGRAITPTESPIRFHARFFVADGALLTKDPAGSGELTDLAWFTLDEAIKLPQIDVTTFMIEQYRDLAADRAPMPLFVYRNNRPAIRWTHDT